MTSCSNRASLVKLDLMVQLAERDYSTETLPYQQDVERFAIPYTPESFTDDEKSYLAPFFSNIDQPVYVMKNLPEEIAGALSSRYSRASGSLRRMFLREYVSPIADPESQKGWEKLAMDEQVKALQLKGEFSEYIGWLNTTGGIDRVVNIQRGRKFFEKWLADFGDDSIAEMGNVHLSIEGLSNIATKEIQDKRIGLSPIEKSTRYVQFWERRPDGSFQYVVPGELKGTELEQEFRDVMDLLFNTYASIAEPYLDYIKERYPQEEDENSVPFANSRSAKRFDDIRDLLPFSTQTSVGFNGNGRAYEELLSRLMNNNVGELRWLGQKILHELEEVVPSFVERPKTARGAEVQKYRSNIEILREEMAKDILGAPENQSEQSKWVQLVSHSEDQDIDVLSKFLYKRGKKQSLRDIRNKVTAMAPEERSNQIGRILEERKFNKPNALRQEVRFRKPPRAFEAAHFTFDMWGRGGDYRDLQRHRGLTQERQPFTVDWGYDVEPEVSESPFLSQFQEVFDKASALYHRVSEEISPDIAQYVVPFGFIQHWYWQLSARELYWIAELRTGPQGREHYRQIVQDMTRQAKEASPVVMQGVMVDLGSYALSRRESEKRIYKKKEDLAS